MALGVCEDCRHDVSDQAEMCLQCGRPMAGGGADRSWAFQLAGVMGLFGVMSIAYSLVLPETMAVDESRVKFWFGFELVAIACAFVALGWWKRTRAERG